MTAHTEVALALLDEAGKALEQAANAREAVLALDLEDNVDEKHRDLREALQSHGRLVALAHVHALLDLGDVLREALAPEVATAPAEPAPTTAPSLWQPVDVDTVWEPGDLAMYTGDDSPNRKVVAASTDSFGDVVLRVHVLLDPRDDTPDEQRPVEVERIERGDLYLWRRKPKAIAS